jgi:NADH:ubiquinone oxidoreductase subunit F (NADH-binding)
MTSVVADPLLLTGDDPSYAAHVARLGPVPELPHGVLRDRARAVDLRGRGGGAFPAWRKIAGTPQGATVVGNGAEGEPLSAKDRTLLTAAPHRVIDGLVAVARAVRAGRVALVVAAGPGYEAAVRAVAERPVPVDVVAAPRRFVAGQETAVLNLVRSGTALPTTGRPPSLVLNVETLAHLGLLARDPRAFEGVGSPAEPGTRLHTVSVAGSGALRVAEVPTGTPTDEVLRLAGVDPSTTAAVLVGGYHGSWSPDAPPGAGVLVALPTGRCPLAYVGGVLTYLAGESAGQCGPCVNGLPALAASFGDLLAGRPHRVPELVGLIDGRGGCHHPDGTARLVRSTLAAFGAEVAAHARGGCAR